MEVRKSDGLIEEYSRDKVKKGIEEAYARIGEKRDNPAIKEILSVVESEIYDGITSAEIREIVERELSCKNYKVAKEYILFWDKQENIKQFVLQKEEFIEKYKKSKNNADATVDDNSNATGKNVSLLNAEIHKKDNILISRGMITRKLKELYPSFNSRNYVKDLENHIIYKHDESSFAGPIAPYCVSISMYPFILEGTKVIGGTSAAPKNLAGYCGSFCNLLFAIASQYAGACMYKDQTLLISENGTPNRYTSKDFVEKYLTNSPRTFENYQGVWEYNVCPNGIKVLENGKLVDVKKVYRRKYSDDIYKITTKDGYTALVTKDHIFKQLLQGRELDIKSEQLEVNDTVFLNKDYSCILDFNSEDFKRGWIVGMMCGDGSLTEEDTVRLSVNYEQEYLGDTFNEYLRELYGYELSKNNGHKCFNYTKHSRELKNIVHEDIIGDTAYDKHIDINGKSLNYLSGFLDGLFCSDGSYTESRGISISLTNKELAENVSDIVAVFGLPKKEFTIVKPRGNRKEAYQQYVSSRILKYLRHTHNKCLNRGCKNIQDSSREVYYYGYNAFQGRHKSNKRMRICESNQEKDYKTDVIVSIEKFKNDDVYVYEIETASHWYNCGGFITHNCATPEFLLFFDWFARKEWGDDYYMHVDECVTCGRSKNKKTIRDIIEQHFQGVIYSINSPASSRNSQSPFVNFSYFDKPFFESMFENFRFPDGTEPKWESLNWLQREFMMWFNEERTKTVLTFPVESFALIYKDGKFLDEDSANFVAEELARGHSFFIYISDTADSLSSCCRLRNKIQSKEFSFTNGNIGVETGSKSVITLNLNRITQDFCRKEFGERPNFIDFTDENKENFGVYIAKILGRVYKYHTAYNEYLWDMYDAGLLPVYKAGFIDLNKQYLTVGINGLNQAAEYLGLKCSKNDDYKEFCSFMFTIFENENNKHRTKKTNFNLEFVPAESLAIKNYNWDKEDGYWVPEDTNLYASYVFKPNENDSVLDRLYMMSNHFAMDKMSGGAAAHINLDSHLSKAQYKHLLNYCGEVGCTYWTVNVPNSECECGYITKHPISKCPKCGSTNITYYDRVIGYLTKIKDWSEGRRIEQKTRVYNKEDNI